jgi:hypothetical protein
MSLREQSGGAITLRQTREKPNMKVNNIILTVSVAALSASLNLNARAGEPLLSPRARDNQIRTVPGMTEDRLERGLLPASPRWRDNRIKVVRGVSDDPDLISRHRKLTVSPRALEACPRLGQTAARK